MSGSMNLPTDFSKDQSRRDVQDELDKELNKYTFTHNNQIFDDSPNKSELNQFGDFSGTHSHFDNSGSVERGMANLEKSTDFSFRSKSAMPPMSTLSSLSSHVDSPRKTRSEGAHRSSSISRFSPMSTKKVTALGMHESESEYSPSKYYKPERTPHAASRMNPNSMRKVSPKSFKNTATLFNDLGLDDSVQADNMTTMPVGQSFVLARDVPEYFPLLRTLRKQGNTGIDSIPVSEDNQKLFEALQDLQTIVDSFERQNRNSQDMTRKLKDSLKRAEENSKTERERATFAENELKQHLSNATRSAGTEAQLKALEARNATLLTALNTAKKDLENRTLELELAREEAASVEEECNGATERLAKALENVTRLTMENESLKAQLENLRNAAPTFSQNPVKNERPKEKQTLDDRISERLRRQTASATPVSEPARKATRSVAEEPSYTDEGIEVSRSILNDSEIEEITLEVEESRRRNARKPNAKIEQRPKTRRTASAEVRPHKKNVDKSVKSKLQPETTRIRSGARQTASRKTSKPVIEYEYSEEDTYASAEEADENESESDPDLALYSDDEDEGAGFLSTADDEPSQILYRRKPATRRAPGASKINVQRVISELSRHDVAKCTICSRKANASKSKTSTDNHRKTSASKSPSDDPNATIRPSQPPVPALHSVLAGLEDEFRHLKIKYHSQTDEYHQLDPSLGKKRRKSLAQDLRATIEALEAKADQIYAIFDVLEAAATGVPMDHQSEQITPSATQSQPGRREWIHT